mgnify:CR=1 FL=1
MMILYNPKTGSPIPSFHLEGSVISGDKDPAVVLAVNELAQFEPGVGEFMKKNWGFLVQVTPEEAKKIVEKPKEASFKCQYCNFSTEFKMALTGHLRTHSEEIALSKKPSVDPTIIPVIKAVKTDGSYQPAKTVDEDIAVSGGTKTDKDGVSWYGPGSTEEPRSQSTIGPMGINGHFGGGV